MAENNKYSHYTDEQLLHTYRRTGDNEWLGQLLHRYTALLLGVAMKYLKDIPLAEDAVQHVFLKALTRLPDGEINNFKGWLYILMRNHCLQQLRDRVPEHDDSGLVQLQANDSDEEAMQEHEYTLQQMEDAILQLSEEQQVTINMFYLQKCSYEQITAKTGYSFMQVKSYIQNGKRNLKSLLIKKWSKR